MAIRKREFKKKELPGLVQELSERVCVLETIERVSRSNPSRVVMGLLKYLGLKIKPVLPTGFIEFEEVDDIEE